MLVQILARRRRAQIFFGFLRNYVWSQHNHKIPEISYEGGTQRAESSQMFTSMNIAGKQVVSVFYTLYDQYKSFPRVWDDDEAP